MSGRKMKNWGSLILIIFLIAAGWLVYNHYETSTQPSAGVQEPSALTVGWIGPQTGPVKVLGDDNLKAVQLAFSEYAANKSGTPVKLLVADDQYEANQCVAQYKKMMQSVKPVAIFISTYSCAKVLAKQASEDSVILINVIDNDNGLASLNTEGKANLFLIAKETEGLAGIVANVLISQNKKNIVVIYYGGDDFMPTLAHSLAQISERNGKTVNLFGYQRGKTSFKDFLTWGKEHNADAYVFFGYVEMGLAMKQARDMGITAPFYSVNVITDPVFLANAKGTANGTFFAHFTYLDGDQITADRFRSNFHKRYNEYPTVEWTAMQAYDASNILLQAINEAKSKKGDFEGNLRDILRSVSNYPGISGTINIRPNGASQGIYPSLYILNNGKAEKVR